MIPLVEGELFHEDDAVPMVFVEEGFTASDDDSVLELNELARRSDDVGFRALAACLMPRDEIDAVWGRTRWRLRLGPDPCPTSDLARIFQPITDWLSTPRAKVSDG